MSELTSRERLQPSLLDRLTDNSVENRRESFDQQTLSMTQLRAAVLRDLTWLLNTTNLTTEDDLDGAPLAAASTINYGVPGFTGMIGTEQRMSRLETAVAEAIRRFEPRIRPDTLRVKLRQQDEEAPSASVIFEIHGELWAQPVPQQLFLESAIEIETRMTVVTESRGRG